MKKETFTVSANGVDFYCEMKGEGPLVALVPDGSNDCGPYERLMEELYQRYTVLTFDMRGGTRSMDENPGKITPSVLGDDVAAIVKHVNKGSAAIYGCSSGGQAVLAAAKRHPEQFRNVLVHEAALQSDTPVRDAGFHYFTNIASFQKYFTGSLEPGDFWGVCNAKKALLMGEDVRSRIQMNSDFWGKWYLGTVDTDTYTEEDFSNMPPVAFSVGAWSPSWLVYANLSVAARGRCPVTWFECAHHPEITCPKEYAAYMEGLIEQYI